MKIQDLLSFLSPKNMENIPPEDFVPYMGKTEQEFLKYQLETACHLHDMVVDRYWQKPTRPSNLTCAQPFERLSIFPGGEAYTCCSLHLQPNYYIGNIYKDTAETLWNSERAKRLRYSVAQGDFEYCTELCPYLRKGLVEDGYSPLRLRSPQDALVKNYQEQVLTTFPRTIVLCCDETCNLTCRSCRHDRRGLRAVESQQLYETLMRVVRPMLKDCEYLRGLGSGEFFASTAVQKFYKTLTVQEFPKLGLFILTNGQLLTPEKWQEFKNLQGMPIQLRVSVDASQKDTYELLRRGASWDVLVRNMQFLSKLRQSGELRRLGLSFVVQTRNYWQIPDFVALGKTWGVDFVEFQRLGNYSTYRARPFLQNDILDPQNSLYVKAKTLLE